MILHTFRPNDEYFHNDYFVINNDDRPVSKYLNNDKCANGNCEMALHDSFGFFDDIENDEWIRKKYITTELYSSWFNNPKNPDQDYENIPVWMANNVPAVFNCNYLLRVGGYDDGAKWVCDVHRLAHKKDCLIYSIGSNGQFQFEDGINDILGNNNRCEIHVFDPNPIFSEHSNTNNNITSTKRVDNIFYHAWGIQSSRKTKIYGGQDDKMIFYTLNETFYKLGHSHRHIDIFKIDCEGCEWTAYEDILRYSDQMTQILIELHPTFARPDDLLLSDYFLYFRERNWIPFYREANMYGMEIGVYEYSFIRLRNFYKDV